MFAIEDSLLLKGLKRSMISQLASRPRAIVSVKGWSHFYDRTYEHRISWLGILGMRGQTSVSLVENYGPKIISDGASPTTTSALGDSSVRTLSSNDAQASLKAS